MHKTRVHATLLVRRWRIPDLAAIKALDHGADALGYQWSTPIALPVESPCTGGVLNVCLHVFGPLW